MIKSNEIAMSNLIKKHLGDKFCWLCSNLAEYEAISLRGDVLHLCGDHDLDNMSFTTLTLLSDIADTEIENNYELISDFDIIDSDYERRCAFRRQLSGRCVTCGR